MLSRPTQRVLAAVFALVCAAARGDVTTISVADGTLEQPNFGHYDLSFPILRSGDTSYAVAVTYRTADGTAVATEDYRGGAGLVLLEAGATTGEIPVWVWGGNEQVEETFELNLLSAVGIGPAPVFGPQQAFATGDEPVTAQSADLNGDGKPDLVVVNRSSDSVSVLLNATAPGAATPAFAAQQAVATGDSPVAIALPDLNGDGKPDLALGYEGAGKKVSVQLNTTVPGSSNVAFAAAQDLAVGAEPRAIVATDVNGDGKPDLVAANRGDSTLSVLLNTTLPGSVVASFAAQQTFATGSAPASVVTADVNGDGRPDLASANYGHSAASVLLNTTPANAGTASFAAQQTFAAGQFALSVTAADLDQDGRVDLIVGLGSTEFNILFNETAVDAPSASFRRRSAFIADSVSRLAAADVNGDGRPELVGNVGSEDVITVLTNQPDPPDSHWTIPPQTTFATGDTPTGVHAVDLNADDKVDFVVPNVSGDSVSVLLNALPDSAFNTSYEPQLGVAQAIGTILPYSAPVGGHGGSSLDAGLVLMLLAFAALRRR